MHDSGRSYLEIIPLQTVVTPGKFGKSERLRLELDLTGYPVNQSRKNKLTR